MSLLEEARKIEVTKARRRKSNREEAEVVVAYLKDDITYTQCRKVLGITENTGSGAYSMFLQILAQGIRNGYINIKLIDF